jgi:predicted RNA-binding protein with PUA-like domain
MMAYWLMKTEPGTWSWAQQVAKGAKGEAWTGVRNHQAKLNLMKMRKGDRALFFHTGAAKEIVGAVEVVREHYPDPTAKPGEPWVAVDVRAIESMAKPVTLAAARGALGLKNMVLVNNTRLSVQTVTATEWATIRKMGGMK